MNELSDTFHADLDAIKKAAEELIGEAVGDAAEFIKLVASQVPAGLAVLIPQVEAVVLASARAGLSAALGGGIGGGIYGAMGAGEAAALASLIAQGVPLAEQDYVAIKAVIAADAAKAIQPPAAG